MLPRRRTGGVLSFRLLLGGTRAKLLLILLLSQVMPVSGSGLGSHPDLTGLDDGWMLKRAEELAVVMCAHRLSEVTQTFARWVDQAVDGQQARHGHHEIYAKSGRMIKMCDHLQLIIMNALQNKTKCQT